MNPAPPVTTASMTLRLVFLTLESSGISLSPGELWILMKGRIVRYK
jgi:hypothetical protein